MELVFVHAIGESGRAFDAVARMLRGVRVHAPDLRGHGDARKPGSGYAVADFARDVLEVAAPLGRPVLVGSSSGGLVAQRVAADHPDRVRALVLVGSPRTLRGREPPAGLLEGPIDEAFVRGFCSGLTHRPLDPAVLETLVAEGLKAPPHVWHATARGLLEAPPADGITAPTLILWGERDALLDRAEQDALAAAIPGARLIAYPDVGHLPLWEAPERVAADIEAFLKGL